jgi:hypothetical protein
MPHARIFSPGWNQRLTISGSEKPLWCRAAEMLANSRAAASNLACLRGAVQIKQRQPGIDIAHAMTWPQNFKQTGLYTCISPLANKMADSSRRQHDVGSCSRSEASDGSNPDTAVSGLVSNRKLFMWIGLSGKLPKDRQVGRREQGSSMNRVRASKNNRRLEGIRQSALYCGQFAI